uniref:NADH dehydrogenase subunit 5 n=1 Tax=Neoseiulus californicus TaxID=84382 RepID=UPI0022DCD931|nr:NADH dehydrogenase subunit 5 [Neoseiulus californicus]UZU69611.1 NADH dehydrogenase subunit 5 [Neoseiulus californicus]WJN56891.1 NADH dehydrogenase subunit 5 [Neoseiulus californicus]WKV28861.1 NADH dehydrogenase subunit 5 [Neoseiulus californicus]
MYFIFFSYVFLMKGFLLLLLIYLTFMEEKLFILEWSLVSFNFFFEMKFYFYFDFISNFFMLIVSLISSVVFYFSWGYMSSDKTKNKFLFLTVLFVFSMYLVILSLNMPIIMIGWDGLGIVSYFLVIYYNSDYSNYSGIVTVMTNRLGDIGMMFSFFLLLNMNCFDMNLLNQLKGLDWFFFFFLILGCFTKSAQFPFSAWLPLAMAAPTPISSLVHSSTLVTAGVYLFIRFSFLFKNDSVLVFNLLLLSGLTMLVSALSASVEYDIKKIIAYSTLSQLGLMMMVLMAGDEILAFYHILTHALFKALMFLCSGVFIHSCLDNQDIRKYSDSLNINFFAINVFFISSLSLMGFPFLSGFYSKDLILEFIYSLNFSGYYMSFLMILTSMTTFYSLRLVYLSFVASKNFSKMLYSDKVSLMNMFFFLFLGVVFLGGSLNWLIMEKFELGFFSVSVKLINVNLMVLGFMIFYIFLKLKKINFLMVNYMLNMFFLMKFQGLIFNFLIKNSMYFYYHSEYFLENFSVNSFKFYLGKMNFFISLIKLLSVYISVLILIFIVVILF